MVHLSGFHDKGSFFFLTLLARRRDRNSVIQIDLLVFFAKAGVHALLFTSGRRARRHSLVQLLRMLDEPLHFLVMDLLLNFFQVLLVLLARLDSFVLGATLLRLLDERCSCSELRGLGWGNGLI